MEKRLNILLLLLSLTFVVFIGSFSNGYSQCFGDFARPSSGTITPVCGGSEEVLFAGLGASHYLKVDLTDGVSYIFNSTVSTDYLTISTDANHELVWGDPPLAFTPSSTGTYRIHVVLNAGCQQGWGSRDISAQCGGGGGGGGGTTLYEEDFATASPKVTENGWDRKNGSDYTCVAGNYVYCSSYSGYFATNTFHVPRGKGVSVNFDMKRSSGSSTLEVYARVGGYGTFNTSYKYRSGWMKLNTSSLSYSSSCSNFTINVPGEICGGQDLSICFAASGSNISIDNILITDNSAKASVPDISSAPLTYDFDGSTDFYGPVNFDQFDPAATTNNFSYHSRYGCNNSTGAYAYISSSGGNGGQVGQGSVSGGNGVIYKTTADCDDPAPNNIPSIITREFNTANCSGSTATLRFAFKTSYSGYTFDENYTSWCPEIYYHQTTDGSTTGYNWTECNVNYYFPDGNWWYATTDLPKAENLIVAFAAKGATYSNFDDIKISCKDCEINDETGGAISCTSVPGLTEYIPNTDYAFTIGATSYATHYKWFIRNLTTSEIYYGTTAGADPAVVSGQGTQTPTINFGSTGGANYRVMCIPYDSDYGTDISPTDACYAKISYYPSLSEGEIITPVKLIDFGSICENNKLFIFWSTASETNSDYFVVQESCDAKIFEDVAIIKGAGNTNVEQNYQIEIDITNAKTYYRLKQVDFDGNSETFNIIHVDCGNDVNSQITAYPNPFDGKILYLNSTSTLINSVINIYDALGRLVYQTKCDEINSHVELKIDTKLDPGAYYLEINSENEIKKRISVIVK
ncbi:MAG: T9SS type A sorting domain-containing protein [Bacteroidales bacterium]|nr:T9SS type A sorting domain-containing protein [Bacteroidales bacterium]